MTAEEFLNILEGLRRAQTRTGYAPHKPLLVLLELARVQRGESSVTRFTAIEPKLRRLLQEFGPTNSEHRAHLPFWHLMTDAAGRLWKVRGPGDMLAGAAGNTPTLTQLRSQNVSAGFTPEVESLLQSAPDLIETAARQLLDSYFPETLHEDIAAETGLNLHRRSVGAGEKHGRRRRDPGFRERVLRAYEYRCCVCGFDLRVAHLPVGLEAAHIQWHTAGGPDIEQNGLALCAVHHKLFDLGAFTIRADALIVSFSEHAVAGERGLSGPLERHGKRLLLPQRAEHRPGSMYLVWNYANVFKAPERPLTT
jgi:putative restriction endonuclease